MVPPTLLILGPTAGGKSALAVEIAQRIPGGGECISADSMQVYRGMDIGTAKPTMEERRGVPHHLIDLADPADDGFSVDRWLERCEQTVSAVRARGRTPIIVGGTNLYVQMLLGGMAEVPPADERLRAELGALPPDALRERLIRADPVAADRIHRNDQKRAIRAIEVFEQTGQRLSALQTQWAVSDQRSAMSSQRSAVRGRIGDSLFIVGLEFPVEAINRRINTRVKLMIEHGLLEEVRSLHAAGALGRNAREALGYKQIIDHLDGRCTLEQAAEQIKIRTRRFAKQQRTWLRRFRGHQPSIWLEAEGKSIAEMAARALEEVERAVEDGGRKPGDGGESSV